MWIHTTALLCLVLAASACWQQRPQEAPAADAILAAKADAGLPAARLVLSVRERLLDGGVEAIELHPNERTPIEPTQHLELSTNIPLHNYRIRVLDEVDRAMVSDDIAESSDERLEYRISFHQPLKPGHRYTLVLDAQSGSSFSDPQGNAQPDRRLELQVTGEREKAPAKKAKKRRRR
jgi:hypothetical protein